MEERVPLSKSETIFLQPDFPELEQLDSGYIHGINSAEISGFKKNGGLRFNLKGWAHVWFRGGVHVWFGIGGSGFCFAL